MSIRSAPVRYMIGPWLRSGLCLYTVTQPRESARREFAGNSVARELREAIGVVVVVAESLAGRAGALHEEADVEFVGHADAAVHLHCLVGRDARHVTRLALRQAHEIRSR